MGVVMLRMASAAAFRTGIVSESIGNVWHDLVAASSILKTVQSGRLNLDGRLFGRCMHSSGANSSKGSFFEADPSHPSFKPESDQKGQSNDRSNASATNESSHTTWSPPNFQQGTGAEYVSNFHQTIHDDQVSIMDVPSSRPPQPELVEKYLSPAHFNAAEQYKWRKHELIAELQQFEHDTGTTPVQIGLLSERIRYLTKHTLAHKKDHHGRRGLLILLSRRRKLLKYLRKKDFDAYVKVIRRFQLKDNYYQSGWGEKYRVGTNLKWTPENTEKESLAPAEELRKRLAQDMEKRKIKKIKVNGKVLTGRGILTHQYSSRITQRRADRMKDVWQQRLKECQEFLPSELQKPQFEQQQLQAQAQRGELDEEGLARLRTLRKDQRQKQAMRRAQEKQELEAAVRKQYMQAPGKPRLAATGSL